LTAGLGGMGVPSARGHHERRRRPLYRLRPASHRPADRARYSDVKATPWSTAFSSPPRPATPRPLSMRRLGTRPTSSRSCSPWARDRRRHRPDLRARPAATCRRCRLRRHGRLRGGEAAEFHPARARESMATHVERWSASRTRAPRCSTRQLPFAVSATRRVRAGVSPSRFVPATSGRCFCEGRGRSAGRAVRRPGRHRGHRPGGPGAVPGERVPGPLDQTGRRAGAVPGLPARSAGSATASVIVRVSGSTRWSRRTLKAPIVIGRDHLDCGSVARRTARPRRCLTL